MNGPMLLRRYFVTNVLDDHGRLLSAWTRPGRGRSARRRRCMTPTTASSFPSVKIAARPESFASNAGFEILREPVGSRAAPRRRRRPSRRQTSSCRKAPSEAQRASSSASASTARPASQSERATPSTVRRTLLAWAALGRTPAITSASSFMPKRPSIGLSSDAEEHRLPSRQPETRAQKNHLAGGWLHADHVARSHCS